MLVRPAASAAMDRSCDSLLPAIIPSTDVSETLRDSQKDDFVPLICRPSLAHFVAIS